ncbi:MAG: glutamate--tRNA ligase [Candidatus Thermofonsia Clade 1 bacterium]|uniref:Glutamate--tRNA ligase n=1 Tax=Candidatus Thermofonsia Clade 1 bacterium TaxID=2364210 RepID=A0A2M8PFH7_9CHLR|nr:MAG: glutamate--tRNA ligase [Candidatus Thermofonsia Clade 1 bacterium]RMF49464.1 MAG: glutamate--tRNA ligase [Chloroflexota bacterium]
MMSESELKPARTRYAPSPTGRTHLGNLRTALFAWLWARHTHGQFILRIEDTDRERLVEGAQEELMDALRWLGLTWDEGPDMANGRRYVQSYNLARYHEIVAQLLDSGRAYYCDCSPERLEIVRRTQQARGQKPRYDNHCRARALGAAENRVVRFAMPERGETLVHDLLRGTIRFENADHGDPIILKSDGYPTYHLASVVDDHDMRITHVIRADEWLPSTPIHVNLYAALGWQAPHFVHLPLVTDHERRKIKKRSDADQSAEYAEYAEMLRVATLRQRGYLPQAVFNFLAFLGWHPGTTEELMTPEEIVARFTLDRLSTSSAVFDVDRLNWFNQQHMKRLSNAELSALLVPYLQDAYPESARLADAAWCEALTAAVRDELVALSDVVEAARFAFEAPQTFTAEALAVLQNEAAPVALSALSAALPQTAQLTRAEAEATLKSVRDQLKQAHGLSGKQVLLPIRVALTGKIGGAHLTDILALLSVAELRERLQRALSKAPTA